MKSDILLISATKKEISELLKISEIKSETTSASNKTIVSAKLNKTCYDLLITGPSIINAAHALTIVLEKNRPKIIIQAGYAGIFKESNLLTGDIVIATEERYIHTGVESSSNNITPDDLPFELIDKTPSTKSGIYYFSKKYTDQAYQILTKSNLAKECSISKGLVITVSTITSTQKTTTHLYKAFSPLMEAMEGAALAHVASLYKVLFLEIRSGSNYVGERDKKKWNTSLASKNISKACALIIENLF
ncbi:MAG: futalosine hydrolase [Desulfobacterales bacterium]|nr:futalosine hydrolase [Desulfobacterales bacterium]